MPAPRKRLTCERLRALLRYEPESGAFIRLVDLKGGAHAGEVAGTLKSSGYRFISVDGKQYRAHRLAWLYMTGAWPQNVIDHRDGNPANNAWVNLRSVERVVNQQNQRRARSDSLLGVLGVSAFKGGRFKAQIKIGKKNCHLGVFDSIEQAHNAYLVAKRKHHEGCTI